MHIPDAFIPMGQALAYWVIALIFIVLALRWARNSMGEERCRWSLCLRQGIFAMQAFNIPVPWGTTGHLLGAALAAIVLGSPYAGIFVLTLVLLVQGIIFGDGGITVMGANIINMGVVGGFIGYYGYTALNGVMNNAYIAAFIAAWRRSSSQRSSVRLNSRSPARSHWFSDSSPWGCTTPSSVSSRVGSPRLPST